MKILCIEDDHETAKLIAEELTERGFDVIIAHDGHEGFIATLKGIPDLVLCDISLPNMSGLEVLTRLNEFAPRTRCIPFVFLTAATDRQNELQARRLGADDYVRKPIDFDRLVTILRVRLRAAMREGLRQQRAVLHDVEAEALVWLALGKTPAEIATMLGRSEFAVDIHLNNARTKLAETAARSKATPK